MAEYVSEPAPLSFGASALNALLVVASAGAAFFFLYSLYTYVGALPATAPGGDLPNAQTARILLWLSFGLPALVGVVGWFVYAERVSIILKIAALAAFAYGLSLADPMPLLSDPGAVALAPTVGSQMDTVLQGQLIMVMSFLYMLSGLLAAGLSFAGAGFGAAFFFVFFGGAIGLGFTGYLLPDEMFPLQGALLQDRQDAILNLGVMMCVAVGGLAALAILHRGWTGTALPVALVTVLSAVAAALLVVPVLSYTTAIPFEPRIAQYVSSLDTVLVTPQVQALFQTTQRPEFLVASYAFAGLVAVFALSILFTMSESAPASTLIRWLIALAGTAAVAGYALLTAAKTAYPAVVSASRDLPYVDIPREYVAYLQQATPIEALYGVAAVLGLGTLYGLIGLRR